MLQHSPQGAFGNPSHLGSEEYLRTRKLGETEAEKLGRMDAIPVAVPVMPRVGCEIWNEDFVFRWAVQTKPTDVARDVVEVIGKPIPSNRNRRSQNPQGFSDDAEVLLAFLIAQHKYHTDEQNFTSVGTNAWIAKQLSERGKLWDATRVSRAMTELMKAVRGFENLQAKTRYRRFCDSGQICNVLALISMKPIQKGLNRESGVDDLDQFQDRGF